jgi:predicted O-methyltransferase YrrM
MPPVLGMVESYLQLAEAIPGWTRGEEARELLRLSASLPAGAVLVEVGSFFGSGTVLLAGARQARGSGMVHCVDPFDCTGDAFSIPYYQRLLAEAGGGSLRDYFDANIRNAGLTPWVTVHQGCADEVARRWTTPIDLLFLDGDQSREGARKAYDAWAPFLKETGIIALHNSMPENRTPHHDGHRRVVEEKITSDYYHNIRLVSSTTFAVKI